MLAACWKIVVRGWSRADSEACHAARRRIRALVDEVPAYYEILFAHVQWLEGDYEGACQTAHAGISRAVETGSLVVYLSAHSSLVNALFHLGREEELLSSLYTAIDVAEKNGNAPWIGIFRATLAWVRLHTGDLTAARTLSDALLREHTEEPPGQARTMAMVTAGCVELGAGNVDRAYDSFHAIAYRPEQPRFFLDWYWRMLARYGVGLTCLRRGEVDQAKAEAELLSEAVSAGADPALKVYAEELEARIHIAAGELDRAAQCLERARKELAVVEVPHAAKLIREAAKEIEQWRSGAAQA
jgi:hypothetical protein